MTDEDDEVMAGLRRAAGAREPVPELVVEAGRAALSTRRLDEELATLLTDSAAAAPELVRAGESEVRLLLFESAQLSAELQVEHLAGGMSVRGLVTGATGEAIVETASERRAVPIGADGWFVATDLPRGAVRVRLVADDGTAVVTSWTLP